MNREEIKNYLPHREPMLLIDEAEAVSDTQATGKYTVRGDEFFLQGHFPGKPVVPGVILCEILAQTACVLLSGKALGQKKASESRSKNAAPSGGEETTPFFTTLDRVKFKNPVLPGDTLEIQCELVRVRQPFYFAKAKGRVNGKLCVSCEFSFALINEAEEV